MSLLDKGTDHVVVYPEEVWTDSDGNTMIRAASTGIPTTASVQILAQSGTSARRSEQDNEGFESEEVYRVRFPRSFTVPIGAQARVEWRGVMWSVIGEPRRYNGSRRTTHLDYTIRRT